MDDVTLSAALGWLLLVFTVAVALGLTIYRLEVRSRPRGLIDGRSRPLVGDGISGGLGFIGGSAAFLLGFLMLTSINQYDATDKIVNQEALAYGAAYDSATGLAPADRAKIHRDLTCLMRSVATNSWAATQSEDLSGSADTRAWRTRVLADANAINPVTPVQEVSLSALHSELLESSKLGQQRFLAADGDLPSTLWILVYVSIFALTAALTLLLSPYPVLATATLTAILVLSGAMVWTLTEFAEPFTKDDGVYIAPHAINGVMARLQGTYPGPAWEPCEKLAAS